MSERLQSEIDAAALQRELDDVRQKLQESRESEAECRQILARRESHLLHTRAAVMFWDTEFRVVEWNAAAEQIFGYSAAEAIGLHVLDLIVPPDVREKVDNVVAELLRQTGGVRSENANVTKDGRRIVCDWSNTPVTNDDGEVLGVVSIAIDVTEQRKNARLLRGVLENAPDIVVQVDREARILYINRVEENYRQEDLIGQRIYDFVVPEDREQVIGSVEQVFATGELREYEVRDVRNGRWYWARLAPILEAGEITSVVVLCLDIHERRQEQAAARRQEEVFRILAQNVPGVVYVCKNDERYTMLFLNDEVEELLGIPASEFCQDRVSFVELFHPDEASSIPTLVDAAIARRAPFRLRYQLRHADGHWVPVEEHGQGVYDESGALTYLVGSIFDNTIQRRAQESLQHSNAELERQVEVRTQELKIANRLLRDDYQKQIALNIEIRESERQFRNLCQDNPAPVAITRASDGQILYGNARLAEMLGVSKEGLVGLFAERFYARPDERGTLMSRLARQGVLVDQELELTRADGRPVWVIVAMRRIQFNDVEAVLSISLDITDRKSKTRMLRRMLFMNERDRQLVGYEIHDGIVQYMTGINLFLQAAESKVSHDPQGAIADLHTCTTVLEEAIDDARQLIDRLRPGVLEEQGVVPAVEYLCDRTQELQGIKVSCEINVQFQRLAPPVETAIYRIVQEGLSNIVKHSQSQRARVVLSQRTNELVIKIEDRGIGFDVKNIEHKRYGLSGIRDRAKLLGGKAKIRTAVGEGTLLRIKLPLKDIVLDEEWLPPELGSSDDLSSSEWEVSS